MAQKEMRANLFFACLCLFFGYAASLNSDTDFKWIERTFANEDGSAWSTGQRVSPVFCWKAGVKFPQNTDNWVLQLKRSFSFWPFPSEIDNVRFNTVPSSDHDFYAKYRNVVGRYDVCYRAVFPLPRVMPPSKRYIIRLVNKESNWFYFFNHYFPWSSKFKIDLAVFRSFDEAINKVDEAYRQGYETHVKPLLETCSELIPTDGDYFGACRRYVKKKCKPYIRRIQRFIEEQCSGYFQQCSPDAQTFLREAWDGIKEFCYNNLLGGNISDDDDEENESRFGNYETGSSGPRRRRTPPKRSDSASDLNDFLKRRGGYNGAPLYSEPPSAPPMPSKERTQPSAPPMPSCVITEIEDNPKTSNRQQPRMKPYPEVPNFNPRSGNNGNGGASNSHSKTDPKPSSKKPY